MFNIYNTSVYQNLRRSIAYQISSLNNTDGCFVLPKALAEHELVVFRKQNNNPQEQRLGVGLKCNSRIETIYIRPGQLILLADDNNIPFRSNEQYLTLTVSPNDMNDNIKRELALDIMVLFALSANEVIERPKEWAQSVLEIYGDRINTVETAPYIAELNLVHRLKEAQLLHNIENEYLGPSGSIHDIELTDMSIEVKSHLHASINDKNHEIVISSENQLARTDKKPLYIVYYPMQEFGDLTIKKCVDSFSQEDRHTIISKLKTNGIIEGDFNWTKQYSIISTPLVYPVDDNFPRITADQFIHGSFPSGITKIMYHVSLYNLPFCTLDEFLTAKSDHREPSYYTN